MPDDNDLLQGILTEPVYWKQRQVRFVLKRIEASLERKEVADLEQPAITIEHIMPQEIRESREWQAMLGSDWQATHLTYLHTLSNLTLTGFNSELGNHPFAVKKKKLEARGILRLNKQIVKSERWSETELRARGEWLFEQARRLWPGPAATKPSKAARNRHAEAAPAVAPAGSRKSAGAVSTRNGSAESAHAGAEATRRMKRCPDCHESKDRFTAFKPRHGHCRAHKPFDPTCNACMELRNSRLRQPRCKECDGKRRRVKS
jgi:hypothetical protein